MILGNSHCKLSHGLTIRTRTELVMQGQVSRGYRQRSVRQRNLSVVTERQFFVLDDVSDGRCIPGNQLLLTSTKPAQ